MLTETTSEILESTRDSAFKLFGKTIPLHDNFNSVTASTSCGGDGGDDADENLDRPSCSDSSVRDDTDGNRVGEEVEILKDVEIEKSTECKLGDGALKELSEESSNPEASSLINESPKTLSNEKDSISSKPSQIEEQQNDTSNSSLQEKPLKKPDKILPCPRCNSMETKFCYYNNYNMNQPRHFCKKCQRYWTAGGTMRNVPVGAGRRKNKNSASQYRHITVGEGLQTARLDVPNGRHLPELKANGTILNFGPDRPLHESMASILNLTDKTVRTLIRNGFHKPEALSVPVSHGISDDSDKNSNASSIVESTLKDEASRSIPQDMLMANCQGFPPPVPCFPGAPWPYSWNSAQWTSSISPSAFCPPGFPMPVYPAAAYFGCVIPSTWNMPCHPLTSSPTQIGNDSGPNSPTLGKHSRDEDMFKVSNPGSTESKEHKNSQAEAEPGNENTTKRNLWIPKTLRIADPNEAAKSSIWTTLGIKNEASDSTSSKELFKAFEPKGNEKQHANETSTVLQSNPAAYSRSLNFHESL